MRLRMRDIGIGRSPRPAGAAGAAGRIGVGTATGRIGVGAADAAGCAGAAAAWDSTGAAGDSTAGAASRRACTSPFVMRPPLPVPAIVAGSR